MKKFLSIIYALFFLLNAPVSAYEWDCCGLLDGQMALRIDYLYWTAKQESLNYTNEPSDIFTSMDFTSTDLIAPSFDWNSGFRVAAAYALPCSSWVGGLQYTQYSNYAHGHREADDSEGIFPTLVFDSADDSFVVFPEDYVSGAKSKWNLNTYFLDAVVGYEFCIADCFSIIPTLGVRNAWIDQKVHAEYTGGGLFAAGPCDVSLHSKFYGVGPRIGIKPIVTLGYGFNLYAEAAASFLFSWWDIHQSEFFLDEEVAAIHKKTTNFRWNGDLIAGVNWTYCADMCSAIKAYTLDVGFDYLYFSQQYEFTHGMEFSLPKKSQFLMLYGIHVSGGIQF